MICLTREVRMSLCDSPPTPDAPQNSWSGSHTGNNLAQFVVFRVSVVGEPDPSTGYLCDIKSLDQAVREVVAEFTREQPVANWTRQSLTASTWQRLGQRPPPNGAWAHLDVRFSPYLQFSISAEAPTMIQITEQFEFSAAHRLHCPQWSEVENRDRFGKCNNPSGHGHNYVLEVTISGEPDPQSGSVFPIEALERIVLDRVVHRFDHKHLNQDTLEFRDLNPSVENIAQVIWRLLTGAFEPAKLAKVRVYETPKTWAECSC